MEPGYLIEALVFDFDGVIVDTETPDYLSWQDVFSSYGVELDRALWSQFIGGDGRGFDGSQHLESLVETPVDHEAVKRRRRASYEELVEASPLRPGVTEYILAAKRLGLKLGVASSSSRRWVEGHLAQRGLLGYFDTVKTSDDVASVKPAPDLYLASVAKLETLPGEAIAIEDSANGVTAAKRAGLWCLAVPNPMTKDLPLDHADMLIDSLSDLPLSFLVSRASKKDAGG